MTKPKSKQAKRILICGDRNWTDKQLIREVLLEHLNPEVDFIIHGDARGADRLGAEVAQELGVSVDHVLAFPADWNQYHRAAGPIRNQQMLTEGKPTLVLAFHNCITTSKGTKDMICKALKAGLPVYLNGDRRLTKIAYNLV